MRTKIAGAWLSAVLASSPLFIGHVAQPGGVGTENVATADKVAASSSSPAAGHDGDCRV
jgi:hypothetical protein